MAEAEGLDFVVWGMKTEVYQSRYKTSSSSNYQMDELCWLKSRREPERIRLWLTLTICKKCLLIWWISFAVVMYHMLLIWIAVQLRLAEAVYCCGYRWGQVAAVTVSAALNSAQLGQLESSYNFYNMFFTKTVSDKQHTVRNSSK